MIDDYWVGREPTQKAARRRRGCQDVVWLVKLLAAM